MWTEDGYRLEVHRVLPPASTTCYHQPSDETIQENLTNEKNITNYTETPDISPLRISDEVEKISRPAVLVHHGLLSSSADWTLLGPSKALGIFHLLFRQFYYSNFVLIY